jgi:hypothetical protein
MRQCGIVDIRSGSLVRSYVDKLVVDSLLDATGTEALLKLSIASSERLTGAVRAQRLPLFACDLLEISQHQQKDIASR